MTTPAERLAAALHVESAAIAPQTSPLIEAAKEALEENRRLTLAMAKSGVMLDHGYSKETVAQHIHDALHQQLIPEK